MEQHVWDAKFQHSECPQAQVQVQTHGAARGAPAQQFGTAHMSHPDEDLTHGALYASGNVQLHTPFSMGAATFAHPWSQADPAPLHSVGTKSGANTAAAARPVAKTSTDDNKAQGDQMSPPAAGQTKFVVPEQGGDIFAETGVSGQSDLLGSIDTASLVLAASCT